ncbi:MAG: tripartite tricarboxylate transporter permease, partial [Thermoplasmata archaeon]|nr:tripartite tricarboxylate transporter permease [Thermoplasmata archaeon]
MLTFLFVLLLFTLLGVSLGVMTGLIPGLHVNTVAILLLTASPALAAALLPLSSMGIDPLLIPILVASTVVAVSITHTFLDFIPSTYLGAPEEETALSVLPAHSLLLEGKGYRAVYLSALGSIGAVFFSAALLIPYRFLFGPPGNLYTALKENLGMLVLLVAVLLLITERKSIPYPLPWDREVKERTFSRTLGVALALSLFLLSGAFGYAIFHLPSTS